MTDINCQLCLTDDNLTYVNISNTTLDIKNFKIEPIGHDSLHVCLDKDSSGKIENNIYSTCLSERDPCSSPSNVVRNIVLSGLWDVQLEDGTIISNKTLEELETILLDYDLLFYKLPNIDCTNATSSVVIQNNFDYGYESKVENNREWGVYVNGVLFDTSGVHEDGEHLEDILDRHPFISSSYSSYQNEDGSYTSYVTIESLITDVVTVMLVPTNTLELTTPVNSYENPSFNFNESSGIITFCLAVEEQ